MDDFAARNAVQVLADVGHQRINFSAAWHENDQSSCEFLRPKVVQLSIGLLLGSNSLSNTCNITVVSTHGDNLRSCRLRNTLRNLDPSWGNVCSR